MAASEIREESDTGYVALFVCTLESFERTGGGGLAIPFVETNPPSRNSSTQLTEGQELG